jgi:uncharacterized membrane protein
MLYDSIQFWGIHLIWWIAPTLFLVGIFVLSGLRGQIEEEVCPMEILTSRYAEGKIDAAEYVRQKKYIRNNSVNKNFVRMVKAE